MVEERVQRRLAAILAADVVGYSRLMGEDEEATLATLKSYRSAIDELIQTHDGRVFGGAGDSVIAEFASPVEAVRCATEIQLELEKRSAEVPDERRMRFRIGVNLGDVMVEGDNLYGDGVNVAARLEGIAEPGGIWVSGTVLDHVKGKVDLVFEDIGDHRVKNIAGPVRVYRVRQEQRDTVGLPVSEEAAPYSSRSALAVLPFANLSGDREQEYFSDGLTEDIISALSAWHTFPVIARNSVFTYKGKAVKVQQVAADLGARYVLEGSVRKGGNRVRITVQLSDAKTGHHLWAEKFDRELEDIFEVQDEITQRIAATVAPELEMAQHRRGVKKRTTNMDAWDYYQRGMSAFHKFNREANAEARAMFERAIELDPSYAQAYRALADTHCVDAWRHWAVSRADTIAKAVAAGQRAVALDPVDASIRVTFGIALLQARRFEQAISEQERALELNPNDAFAYAYLGVALAHAGRPTEALRKIEKALQLSPARDERADFLLSHLARIHLNLRHYEEAAEWARKAINRRSYAETYVTLASSLGHLSRLAEARTALDECERIEPGRVQKQFHLDPGSYQNHADHEHILDGLRKAGWDG